MVTVELNETHKNQLLEFCESCAEKGYKNNDSLDSMKYQWCLDNGGTWYGSFIGNKLIAVSGVHNFPEISPNAVRVLFRGAQIVNPYAGLTKHHMSSIPFRDHLPLAIEKYENKQLYITSNITNDASGRMNMVHQIMHRLRSQGILTLIVESMELFYTEQSVWRINKESYLNVRERLIQTV